MSEKPIICPYCQSEMVEQSEALSLKNITSSFCCFNCGAYKHVISTKPLIVGDELTIKLTRRPVYYNLALRKPAFEVLLSELRNYLSSEDYEYNTTLESIFFELQAQQQEEDQLQTLVDDDPESITFKED